MRWSLPVAVLIACSDSVPEVGSITPVAQSTPASIPSIAPTPRVPPVVAPPSGILDTIAVVADGTAALTLDSGGGVRLWPTLDGTREPVVIFGMAAAAIAIGRDADGFVIAELDMTGTLEIYRYTTAGDRVARTQVTSDHPFDQIAVTPAGVLALRSDDVLELYAPWGTREGRIAPEPGERVLSFVVRAGRALALTTKPDGPLHGRWLELHGTPRWGAVTSPLAIVPSTAALSPDHTRLVGRPVAGGGVVVVELATGAVTAVGDKRHEPLAFTSADTLLLRRTGMIEWWTVAGKQVGHAAPDGGTSVPPSAITDGRVIGLLGEQLVLFSPTEPRRHLGYQLRDFGLVREAPEGFVGELTLPALGQRGLAFDAALQFRSMRLPTRDTVRWLDQIALDDRHLLVLGSSESDARWLTVIDTRTNDEHPIAFDEGPAIVYDDEIHYDPATRMVAGVGAAVVVFAHYDPKTARFAEPWQFAIDEPNSLATHFVDRVRSGSDAIIVDQLSDEVGSTAKIWDVVIGEAGRLDGKPTRKVPGTVVAVDRAGRIYASDRKGDLAIHGRDRAVTRVADIGFDRIVPRPDATGFVVVGRNRISSYDQAGHLTWSIAAPLATTAWWTAGGGLVVQGGGLLRLDPSTGATLERRCGWNFGLHDKPVDIGGRAALACDSPAE